MSVRLLDMPQMKNRIVTNTKGKRLPTGKTWVLVTSVDFLAGVATICMKAPKAEWEYA